MRPIQEIFDTVIAKGFYGPDSHDCSLTRTPYMCHALLYAAEEQEVITAAESAFAIQAVKDYLKDYTTLVVALTCSMLPHGMEDCQNIYQNWSSRPQLKHLQHRLTEYNLKSKKQ